MEEALIPTEKIPDDLAASLADHISGDRKLSAVQRSGAAMDQSASRGSTPSLDFAVFSAANLFNGIFHQRLHLEILVKSGPGVRSI